MDEIVLSIGSALFHDKSHQSCPEPHSMMDKETNKTTTKNMGAAPRSKFVL